MAAQLEELRVSFRDDVSRGADAAADALSKMGGAAERAGEGVRQTEERVRRAGQSAEQLASKYDGAARVTAEKEAAERRHARALEDVARWEAAGENRAERAAQLRTQIARQAEIDAARIVAAAERRAAAEARLLSGAAGGPTTSIAAAEGQLNRFAVANDNAGRSSARLGQVVGQAGFQVQDFAGQVMAGGNALVALGQQGSQLLGVFGVGGAIAGAALTVGILAYQLLGASEASKKAEEAAKSYNEAMSRANDVLLTSTERAEREEQAKRDEARATFGLAAALERETLARANAVAGRRAESLARLREQVEAGRAPPDVLARRTETAAAQAADVARIAEQASNNLAEVEARAGAVGDGVGSRASEEARRAQVRAEEAARRDAEREAERLRREQEAAARAGERAAEQSRREAERREEQQRREAEREQQRREQEEQRARERAEREAEQLAQANQRRFDTTVERFGDSLADVTFRALEEGAERGQSPFAALAASFGSLLRRAAVEALSVALVQPAVRAGLSGIGFTGAESGAGSMWGSLSSATGLSGLLPAGGFAGITDAIGLTSGGSLFGIGTTPGSFGLNPLPLGSVLGAAGLGALGGGMLAQFTGGNSTGGSIGGGLGAAAGYALAASSLLGPVGPVAAALIGGAGGGVLGGMFGGGGAQNRAYSLALNASGGQLALGNVSQERMGEELAAQVAQAQQLITALNAAMAQAGLSVADAAVGIGTADAGDPYRVGSLAEAFGRLRFTAGNDNVNRAIANRSFSSIEELSGAVAEVKALQTVLDGLSASTDPVVRALNAVDAQFQPLIASAQRLGFGEAELRKARQDGLDAVTKQAEAEKRRAEAQTQQAALSLGLRQSRTLSDWLAGQQLASGSPDSQLAAAQAQFGDALSAARAAGGQRADLSRVTGAADALLRASSSYNATGPAAAAMEAWVRGSITALGRELDLPAFAEDVAAAVDRWGEQAARQRDEQTDEIRAMRAELLSLRLLLQRAA